RDVRRSGRAPPRQTEMAERRQAVMERPEPVALERSPAPRGLARDEAYALGKKLREACPRSSHGEWKAGRDRPDAVDLVLRAEKGRLTELLPLRHGRMARSAFTFYRGAALTMAADLASTPSSGVRIQCCGDAHLSNFGGFATPERRVIFSINDLDETLPAPWEWDLKRLAASFVVASRDVGLSESAGESAVRTCARTYRESMAEFSEMKALELWCLSLGADDLVAEVKDSDMRKRFVKRLAKERARSIAEDIFPRLAEKKGELPVIRDQLPTIFHVEGQTPGQIEETIRAAIASYRATLPSSVQSLLDRYELRDAAIKVVGIGSVGTRCWVLLFMAGETDPLFLQVKEARASVLEPFAGASAYINHGERVIHGYRLM